MINERSATGMRLVDKFGRQVRKMRISVTDRCNFRCQYCMPAGDIPWIPREEILSFEEMARVATVAATMGVERIRLTGGEPLTRPDLHQLLSLLAAIPEIERIDMTTNGYFLPDKIEALRDAGLHGLNISLDSLQAERFAELTRRNYFDRVLRGIEAARASGVPFKINTVVMRGVNDDEIADFIRWGKETGTTVRFIEFMPLDGDHRWNRDTVVTAEEILAAASELGEVIPLHNDPRDPARLYSIAGDKGTFGVIASVSQPFCGNCDRIRLTADGKIRNCLFAVAETDLRAPLRAGASDDDLAQILLDAVQMKWAGHLINQEGFRQPERAMYAIGG